MKKVLFVVGTVLVGLVISVVLVIFMHNFRISNEKQKMISYLEEKYDDDFEIVGDVEKGTFRAQWFNFGLDGSNAQAYKNYGKYYRLKVHSKTKNVDFYVQHLTKDKKIEDNYMFVVYREECKNELNEEFNRLYKGKVSVTYDDIEIDNKTKFSTKKYVKYQVTINENFNPYEVENIKNGIKMMSSLKKYREKYQNDVITISVEVKFNDATVDDRSVYINYDKEVPNSQEIQKLMQIEDNYSKIRNVFYEAELNDYAYVTISYNHKLCVNMKKDNIQINIPINHTDGIKGFEKGGDFSVKEFYTKYKELNPGVY